MLNKRRPIALLYSCRVIIQLAGWKIGPVKKEFIEVQNKSIRRCGSILSISPHRFSCTSSCSSGNEANAKKSWYSRDRNKKKVPYTSAPPPLSLFPMYIMMTLDTIHHLTATSFIIPFCLSLPSHSIERESWITVVEIISDSERRNVFQRITFAVKDDCRWTKRRSFYSDGFAFVFQPNAICFLVVVENKIRNCTMASWNNKTHTKKYRNDE